MTHRRHHRPRTTLPRPPAHGHPLPDRALVRDAAAFDIGVRVRINLTDSYLHAACGTVTRREGQTVVVRLDEPAGHRLLLANGRWRERLLLLLEEPSTPRNIDVRCRPQVLELLRPE